MAHIPQVMLEFSEIGKLVEFSITGSFLGLQNLPVFFLTQDGGNDKEMGFSFKIEFGS